MLLRCYFAFVLLFLEYCSPVWGSAAECYLQLHERHVYSVTRLYPAQGFLSLCHRRRVAGLSMLYKVNASSRHCLFGELPSASSRHRHSRAAAAAHPLKSMGRTSQFSRSFLPAQVRMWNDLPYTVFDTGTLDGFKGAVNRWLVPLVVFSSVFRGSGACVAAKAIYTWIMQMIRSGDNCKTQRLRQIDRFFISVCH